MPPQVFEMLFETSFLKLSLSLTIPLMQAKSVDNIIKKPIIVKIFVIAFFGAAIFSFIIKTLFNTQCLCIIT